MLPVVRFLCKMHIGIATLQKTFGGPKIYAYNLIKNLLSIDRENQYFIFSDDLYPFKSLSSYSNITFIRLNLPLRSLRLYWDNIQIPINFLIVLKLYQ